jgi:phosphoenolpyruvate carboxylase
MSMEANLLIFLAAIFINIFVTTAALYGAYRAFAGTVTKTTGMMAEFQKSSETKRTIDSLQIATERAASVTEVTKQKMQEFQPKLERAQEGYRRTLESIDARLEQTASRIDETSRTVRDVIAKPAFSVASFAAGMSRVIKPVPEDE